jgi:uncharacterized protein (DUF3820 family)
MMRMPIGKNIGKYLSELEASYLLWCLSQEFFNTKYKSTWNAISKEVTHRGFNMRLAEIAQKRNMESR